MFETDKKRRDAQLHIRLTAREKARIKQRAEELGLSVTDYVVKGCRDYWTRNKPVDMWSGTLAELYEMREGRKWQG